MMIVRSCKDRVLTPGCEPRKHRSGWRRRKRARPDEILTAALDVISRRGYDRTRMSDIAARADITKGTIYLYFQSKADLFDQCRGAFCDAGTSESTLRSDASIWPPQ